jgi:hypothetical protein
MAPVRGAQGRGLRGNKAVWILEVAETVRRTLWAGALLLAGAAMVLLATPFGVGITHDSVEYLCAAQHLPRGMGFRVPSLTYADALAPLTSFPPLLSALLAGLGTLGLPPLEGARYLNAGAFGATLVLVATLIRRPSGARWVPVLAAFFVLTGPPVLAVFSFAWSEPVFIPLVLLGILLLWELLERGGMGRLVGAAAVFGLVFLTRYVGAWAVLSAAVGLLVFGRRPLRRRFTDSLLFSLIAVLPVSVWMVRNVILVRTATNRTFAFHPIGRVQLEALAHTTTLWLVPETFPPVVRKAVALLAIVAGLVLIVLYSRRRKTAISTVAESAGRSGRRFFRLTALFAGTYPVFLMLSMSLADAAIPFDNRMLSPLYPLLVVLAALLLVDVWGRSHRRSATRVCLVLLGVAWTVLTVYRTASWLGQYRSDGAGYASRRWTCSATMARLSDMSSLLRVYTNAQDAVYIITGRLTRCLPWKLDPGRGDRNLDYDEQVRELEEDLTRRRAVIVWFRAIPWRWYLSEEEMTQRWRLREVAREPDGVMYEMAPTISVLTEH